MATVKGMKNKNALIIAQAERANAIIRGTIATRGDRQQDAAATIGISAAAFSRKIRNVDAWTLPELLRLCMAYGIDAETKMKILGG